MSSISFEENKSIAATVNTRKKYPTALLVHMRTDQHDYLAETFGERQMADGIRKMIDFSMAIRGGELEELEKEFAEETEPRYLFLRKRIDELKQKKKCQEDDQKTKERNIDDAHQKLLDALKRALWDPERMQRATFKIYADATGLSVQELMNWVNEQAKKRNELE